jgi:hypothetical protein
LTIGSNFMIERPKSRSSVLAVFYWNVNLFAVAIKAILSV